jgi:hypothetical protein
MIKHAQGGPARYEAALVSNTCPIGRSLVVALVYSVMAGSTPLVVYYSLLYFLGC